jgi:hypothetical protein
VAALDRFAELGGQDPGTLQAEAAMRRVDQAMEPVFFQARHVELPRDRSCTACCLLEGSDQLGRPGHRQTVMEPVRVRQPKDWPEADCTSRARCHLRVVTRRIDGLCFRLKVFRQQDFSRGWAWRPN